MSELTVGQLIKIILGVFVLIVITVGISLFFKNSIFDFIKNIGTTKLVLLFL